MEEISAKAIHLTAIPLRSIAAGELGNCAAIRLTEMRTWVRKE